MKQTKRIHVYVIRQLIPVSITHLYTPLFYVIILSFVQLIFDCISLQARVEDIVLKFYRSCREGEPILFKPKHIQFLKKAITYLNDTYEVLPFNIKQHMCFRGENSEGINFPLL